MFARMIEAQLEDDPNVVLPLLGGDAFRKQAYQYPMDAWKILTKTIDRTTGTEPPRVLAMLIAIKLADMVDEASYAMDYAEWLIEHLPEDRKEHGYALSLRGHMSFELREFDEAEKYLDRYLALSEKYGAALDIVVAKLQNAIVPMHRGDFDAAEAIYREGLSALAADGSLKSTHNRGLVMSNLGLLDTFRGRWSEAQAWLEQAYSLAIVNCFDYVRCESASPLGLSKIVGGEIPQGRRMLASGFAQSYRSRYRRMNMVNADYVAAGVALIGHKSEATAILEAFTRFRDDANYERSPAEERLAQFTASTAGTSGLPDWSQLTRPVQVITRACDLLEAC